MPEQFRDEFLVINRYKIYVYFALEVQVEQSIVYVCVFARTITFDLNDL